MKNPPHEQNGTTLPVGELAALIGLDWGDRSHAVALLPRGKEYPEVSTIEHSPESLSTWIASVHKRFDGQPVGIALEASKGPVIEMLLPHPWLVIYPIHPATGARLRQALTPSGAKDDRPDAAVLLDLLRCHREKLRPLAAEDPLTQKLSLLVRARRAAVDRRTALTNEMTSLLKGYFPQALDLVGEKLYSTLALDFLSRWPTFDALKKARPRTLQDFYFGHSVRRPETIHERLKIIDRAQALTNNQSLIEVSSMTLALLVEQIRAIQKHIEGFEKEIAQAFIQHPDAALFCELPAAGPTFAPRLLVAFGTDRERYPDVESFLCYSGIAPVIERSGKRCWTHWRWHASKFLQSSFMEWASKTIAYSSWARAYYDQRKARKESHWVIVRALAFKWIRILWRCWRNNTPYNEQLYLQQLRQRKSPLAAQ